MSCTTRPTELLYLAQCTGSSSRKWSATCIFTKQNRIKVWYDFCLQFLKMEGPRYFKEMMCMIFFVPLHFFYKKIAAQTMT